MQGLPEEGDQTFPTAGSNASAAIVGYGHSFGSVIRGGTLPSPHFGSSPEAIWCRVTATAYRSACESYEPRVMTSTNGSR
ncbi:hypothetical protein [Streptomyces sp. C8S0]|uniref:hypothetical protein n=1 Tax=Streptomyces sp. C8S0 TaxID=2585716 RepID=UPI001D043720|nr:hypothetical protein [Streptomyces sp. C8S0]